MYVILRLVRQVEVDHVGQLVDVDAAGSQVGGHQHAQGTGFEIGQGPGAGPLALVAVNGGGGHTFANEPVRHAVGAVLGTGEHQHLLPVIAANQVAEQIPLAVHVAGMEQVLNGGGRLVCRGGLELDGIVQQPRGQTPDVAGKSGRKQQVLTLGWQQGQDFLDVADEAHVEHPVGLIENQDLNPIEPQGLLLVEVHQPARGGHEDVGPPLQTADLGVHLDPAKHHVTAQVEVAAIGPHALTHLGRQLTGGGEHQRAHDASAGGGAVAQPLQHRQGEACGFAGAGLGRSHHIVTGQHRWYALALDRRRTGVALVGHRLEQGFAQAKAIEGSSQGLSRGLGIW